MSFFIAYGSQITAPGLAIVSKAFPELPYSTVVLIATLPLLMKIFFSPIAGKILTSPKVDAKMLALGCYALFTVGGILPFFFDDSFTFILFSRVLVGISIGLLSPVGAALAVRFFEDQAERDKVMGLGSMAMNGGAILFLALGGWLADISWQILFLGHLIGVAMIIVTLFCFPSSYGVKAEASQDNPSEKARLPRIAYVVLGLSTFLAIFTYPLIYNTSHVVDALGLGTATQAAFVTTMYTVGGVAGGFFFARLTKLLGRFLTPLAVLCGSAGLFLFAIGSTLTILTIGSFIVGIGYGSYWPDFLAMVGKASHPSIAPFALSLIFPAFCIGSFVSPYVFSWLGQFNSALSYPYYVSAASYGLVGLGLLITRLKKPAETKTPSGSVHH